MKPINPIRATLNIAWKDLQVILKDKGFLFVVLLLPAIFSVMFGTINQRALDESKAGITLPIVVVNLDSGGYGAQIATILSEIDALEITTLDTAAEGEKLVQDSQALAMVLLPPDLTENVNNYTPSEIQVVIDPTQETYANMVTGIMKEVISPVVLVGELSYGIRSLLDDYTPYQQADEETRRAYEAQSLAVNMAQVQKMQADPWVKISEVTVTGEELVQAPDNIFAMIVPSFTVMFAFFMVGTMAADLLIEKKQGSLRRLMAAPMPRGSIIAGKMLGYLLMVCIQVTLIFGAASLIFDMPLGESMLGLVLVTLSMGICVTGLGMLIASISKTHRQADTTGTLLGFILAGLGGCISFGVVASYKAGGTMEMIAKLTPHAHALIGYDALMVNGKGLLYVLPQVGILCLFGLVFFLIAIWRFKFE